MRLFVLDANPFVRLYRDQPGSDTVASLIRQAKEGRARLSISVANLSEVFYVLARFIGLEGARKLIERTKGVVESVPVDDFAAMEAAALRLKYKLGFADCFAAELALRLDATLVTADPEFSKLGKRLRILSLPRHKS